MNLKLGFSLQAAAGLSDVKGAVSAASAAAAAMQFPLAQRRKRRILFTQAQVRKINISPSLSLFLYFLSKSFGQESAGGPHVLMETFRFL